MTTSYGDIRSVIRQLQADDRSAGDKKVGAAMDDLLFALLARGKDFDEGQAEAAVSAGIIARKSLEEEEDEEVRGEAYLIIEELVNDVQERIDNAYARSILATERFLDSWIKSGGY